MTSLNNLSMETGMPSESTRKPTRRGPRKKAAPVIGTPKDHHANIGTALGKGDHAGARKHAFAFIRSLPKGLEAEGEGPGAEPDAAERPEPSPAQDTVASGPNPRLLAALRALKK